MRVYVHQSTYAARTGDQCVTRVYVYVCVHVFCCVYACVRVSMSVHMFVCVSACVRVCVCVRASSEAIRR